MPSSEKQMIDNWAQVKAMTLQGCWYSILGSALVAIVQWKLFRQSLPFSGGLLFGGVASSLNLSLLAYAFMGLIINGESSRRALICSPLSLVFLSACGYVAYLLGTIALLGFAVGLTSPAVLGLSKTARTT